MIDEPKPWIRGSPKSIVVIVAHTGAQGEFSSQGEFILAIEGPDSRPRWPAGDKGKKGIDVVIALLRFQVLLEGLTFRQPKQLLWNQPHHPRQAGPIDDP